MATKQTFFVVVDADWYNSGGINHLLGDGVESRASQAQVIMAADADISDHKGVWVSDVVTKFVLNRSDNSPVKMRFMIPWRYVLGLGISDDEPEATIGFKAGVTVVSTKEDVAVAN